MVFVCKNQIFAVIVFPIAIFWEMSIVVYCFNPLFSMQFSDLPLISPILKALTETGYTKPTPIQSQSIPILLEGKDLF